MEIGTVVVIITTGFVGTITAVRYGVRAQDALRNCNPNPSATPLPDYIEIDGYIQIHPSKVIQCNSNN